MEIQCTENSSYMMMYYTLNTSINIKQIIHIWKKKSKLKQYNTAFQSKLYKKQNIKDVCYCAAAVEERYFIQSLHTVCNIINVIMPRY